MIFVPSSTLAPDRQLTFDSYLRLQYLMARNVSPNERYIQSLSSREAVESGGGAENACETDCGYPSRAGDRHLMGLWRDRGPRTHAPGHRVRTAAPASSTCPQRLSLSSRAGACRTRRRAGALRKLSLVAARRSGPLLG